MSRLADYFVVVGYDQEKERSGTSQGKIIQRFPEKDWPGSPFTLGIELFCQPTGWSLSTQRHPPTFFVSVLTDIDADRHYCACLTFHETVSMTSTKPDDEDGDDGTPIRQSLMYAPKCLVLVSKFPEFETFRNCLGLIYTVYLENMQFQIETLVGNILGCVQVPPPGGPQIRFSIGAGDRQALQPPVSSTIPTSGTSVAMLFRQMGITNTIMLFCAAATDLKVLFHSQSYTRLTAASQALMALMYPLKYSYVYIPLLPSHLLEVLNTPTPFIAGVHSSLKDEVSDLLDVIIADLDGGSVHVPECVTVPVLPNIVLSRTTEALTMILNPELFTSDYAFPPNPAKLSSLTMQDKEIRAVFLRLFAELFTGYRSCLTLIRIHPEPFITFHKASFLGHRAMVSEDFLTRVLDGMSYSTFVSERGPPFRVIDIFDEVYATLSDMIKHENGSQEKMMQSIKDLAQQLYINEHPNPQPYTQKIPKPPEGAYSRIHQPQFPILDWIMVQEIIDDGLAKSGIKSKLSQIRPPQPRIVPMGPHITTVAEKMQMLNNNARRLEVLRNCVSCIFENKISDARKVFPAVLRALKSKVSRLALCQELAYHVQSNRAMLEHQQFDLVVRLLNCALQNESSMDENGVAAAMLPLVTSFCRKLCTGVIQFAYTCVQEHAVWANHQFWEATFYQDVQRQIRQLYAPQYEQEHSADKLSPPASPTTEGAELSSSWGATGSWKGSPMDPRRRSITNMKYLKPKEVNALEIAAEQMAKCYDPQLRKWPNLSESEKEEMINNEESTVYSQAIHYANRMVYMRVPLDVTRGANLHFGADWESASNSNITNSHVQRKDHFYSSSIAESDSVDAESGFDEQEISEVGANVVKFVSRFVDKVCTESGVTADHIRSLHQMIPGVVAMHIETLEAVARESKRLPPIQKPKILTPTLLPGEEIVMEGLRVYLLPDGREEATGGSTGGPALIPAEGAIFLTTYRIIFKGTPCDPLACEQIVVRYFPVSTLTKEKKLSSQYLSYVDQYLQEIIQMRANTFQLMKVGFDEEVSSEDVETFRKLTSKIRSPISVFSTFAFSGYQFAQPAQLIKHKEKHASLKGFAKKTLMKTARKAGLAKPKSASTSQRKQKYILPTPPPSRRSTASLDSMDSDSRPASGVFDDESLMDENEPVMSWTPDPKNLERLGERAGYKDYQRLGLGSLNFNSAKSKTEPFRITTVNATYSVCRSYPAMLVVPQTVSDDSIRKFARSHRQYRFPVVSWYHPKTKALLLRASGFHSKGMMGMFKSHHNAPSGTSGEITSTSVEQEKYFHAIVQCTPMGNLQHQQQSHNKSLSDSLTSIDSLMLSTDTLALPDTPSLSRKNPIARAVNSLRSSGGKVKSLGRLGSVRDRRAVTSSGSLEVGMRLAMKSNGSIDHSAELESQTQGLNKAALYVLGEKAQVKNIKVDSFPKCEFVPVDFYEVRQVKTSFKKLLRACVPSALLTDAEHSFYKLVQESEWLQQLQSLMQLSGAVVDLIDLQGSSVMVCLEDGWDITTQVVSLAQVCLDPYYRTIKGFQALVEKEWLSFGHRFTHRSNQTAANQASGFAPVFLQFLDAVHQVHRQFPLSFEYNDFFLKFLAYHTVSNRFRTFMLDNESERMEAGWLLEEKPKTSKIDGAATGEDGFTLRQTMGTSVWDYIDKHHRRSPVFYNFSYVSMDGTNVLRPYSGIASLELWDYYLTEDLSHGPPYDFETMYMDKKQNEEIEAIDGPLAPSSRRIVNGCYDTIWHLEPECFSLAFQDIHKTQTKLDHLPMKWKAVWEKLDHPQSETLQRQMSLKTRLTRSHGRTLHKRSTLEILVRGKMAGDAIKSFGQPHRFEKFDFTTASYCDHCGHLLWGLTQVKQGMRCADCGYNCHEKCVSSVPKNCAKLIRTPSEQPDSSVNLAEAQPHAPGDVTIQASRDMYRQFSARAQEHRTHEGYLLKQGALLKQWKQRWFVLDSMKHQLRWYDAMEDSHCKGYLDLSEVTSVGTSKNFQGAPKRAEDNSFFEMKTVKRSYVFCAPNVQASQEWIDKLNSCIQ
ncbi:myotubularin-related protein 13 isoform X2 [Lingula anatina]|uniref:Myotubularin-related protein 13 isoform X2 n=1 Tax=Lingula anatina TaxID=7574 RepID=A0A2R2MIH7_LINAN|nr:myotubularin-related protein 13 isoform X2 [Lingula anatina]|eukprot:XP_023930025.1 myotubularin-related protein 13 isoform X2 [Lingula anatina]